MDVRRRSIDLPTGVGRVGLADLFVAERGSISQFFLDFSAKFVTVIHHDILRSDPTGFGRSMGVWYGKSVVGRRTPRADSFSSFYI